MLSISVQITQLQSESTTLIQSFQFVSDAELLKQFEGKTIATVQVTEASAQGMDPIVVRIKLSFTDGSFLEVDRKTTRLPEQERRIVHLDLAYQAK